jgi:hypothetical protein
MIDGEMAILIISIDIGQNATFGPTDTAIEPGPQWKCESPSQIVRDDLCCDMVSTNIFPLPSGFGWETSTVGRKQHMKRRKTEHQ